MKYVLSLCDRTCSIVQPWAEAGYLCYCVDIQHEKGEHCTGNIVRVGADLNWWMPPLGIQWSAVFAFPPCTNLAVSGARWFQGKGLQGLIDGLTLVERCRVICEASRAPWFIENPVSTLSTYWRKPDHSFDPCDYGGYLDPAGDAYTKRTNLWVGGGFVMPPKRRVEPTQGSLMHRMAPSADRGDRRAVTPMGFAKAVFEANGSCFPMELTA